MKTEITKQEYYTICGLKRILQEKQRELLSIEDIVHDLFGTKRNAGFNEAGYDGSGWVEQFNWDENTSIDEVLKMLKITVKELDGGVAKE